MHKEDRAAWEKERASAEAAFAARELVHVNERARLTDEVASLAGTQSLSV